jgi:hypothetical protein
MKRVGEELYTRAVAEMRACLEGLPAADRRTCSLLAMTAVLHDLKPADRNDVLRRLARLLRPRPRFSTGVSPKTHAALVEAIH